MFLSLTFFVYHTVSNLARQLRADQVLMAIVCCVMEYTLYLICSAANNASRNVSLSSHFSNYYSLDVRDFYLHQFRKIELIQHG
jgi:hypothetical protein